MHANEVATSVDLARRLLAAQFSQWADLPIVPVASAGTDHALYRLGQDMVLRLPRIPSATGQAAKEALWLPRLAPHLPLEIPQPLLMGRPGEGYPWQWSIYRWIEGEGPPGVGTRWANPPTAVARALARFVQALWALDTTDGPPPDEFNAFRGLPLAARDAQVRRALAGLAADHDGLVDTGASEAAWEEALAAPAWEEPPRWIHGDLQPANLLMRRGRLQAVIDFGCMGVGDPACDLQVAWNFLSGESRDVFREALGVDGAMWARGRGWALSVGLIALPYYRRTNPLLASIARRTIKEVVGH